MATRSYTAKERRTSNVKGKVGKNQLSPTRMEEVKKAVFHHFPLEGWENEKDAWADCIGAIDEAGRKLNMKN